MLDGGGRICASKPHARRPIDRPFHPRVAPRSRHHRTTGLPASCKGRTLLGTARWGRGSGGSNCVPAYGRPLREREPGVLGVIGMTFSDATLAYRISHTRACSPLQLVPMFGVSMNGVASFV
ncbi:hypothetical protein CORC01_13632 [Colletotrichum orchidophilum]|uniref:Uncharacterized protein n=1 Tax=Colletotrichum orchidophilum TaxID=1209926 RepID=A0A1G4APN6_9PEZI|nr:uncharacterized protein CORC01_13632 [Colletotrichum orchidophilum]OHE91076.1 hypothetical protein CORC01_13632 [Colletotrichum orchidophilum]